MSVLFCATLVAYIPNVTFSRISSYSKSSQRGCKNDRMALVPSSDPVHIPVEKVLKKKKGQKQVKKKAFKINAKIEDVGLNED